MAGAVANRAGLLLLVIWKSSTWVLPSPSLIALAQALTVCVPASSSEVWLAPAVKLGAWLIALTLMDGDIRHIRLLFHLLTRGWPLRTGGYAMPSSQAMPS